METKRERGKNYTEVEKELLIDTISNFKTILQNKKTDSRSIKLKDDAWDEVARIWNSSPVSGVRTKEQLKLLYNTLKKKAKKSAAEERKQTHATGNMAPISKLSSLEQRVLSITKTEIDDYDEYEYYSPQSALVSSPAPEVRSIAEAGPSTCSSPRITDTSVRSSPTQNFMDEQQKKHLNVNKLKRDILGARKQKEVIEKQILDIRKEQEKQQLNLLDLKTEAIKEINKQLVIKTRQEEEHLTILQLDSKRKVVELALLELELRTKKREEEESYS